MKFFIKRKTGFTLAEILITLSVIGAVAAITLSSIINNYQKHRTINRLKATYSTLNNAIEMAKNDYGLDINEWELPNTDNVKERSDYFAEHYIMPYLKVVYDCENSSNNCGFWSNDSRGIICSNGVLIFITVATGNGNLRNSRTQIYIYTDGRTKKTKHGKNLFLVELGGGWSSTGLDRNKFWPYAYSLRYNRDLYKNYIKNNNLSVCFALIFHDNWQILDDNPCW